MSSNERLEVTKALTRLLTYTGISVQSTDVANLLDNISHLSPSVIEGLMKLLLIALVDKIK